MKRNKNLKIIKKNIRVLNEIAFCYDNVNYTISYWGDKCVVLDNNFPHMPIFQFKKYEDLITGFRIDGKLFADISEEIQLSGDILL